jgi:hypothetical protein
MTIPEPPAGRIIPLTPGVARGTGDRRELLRAAVLQVVDHLVLESVPPSRRADMFDQAMDMLDEAGWGLDELYAAATEPQAREALLNALGLLSGANPWRIDIDSHHHGLRHAIRHLSSHPSSERYSVATDGL